MQPLPHQAEFLKRNPRKALLNWEMRVGKTLPAALWVDMPCRTGNTYIVTPKQNKKDWIKMGTKATVLTKEEFKKVADSIVNPTAIVIDEIHNFASPLFVKGRSQLATCLYRLVKTYPNCDFLGLSATMVRQDPWSLHTLLCYRGVYIDWKQWRSEFFELKKLPFLRFPAWFPKKDWRIQIRKYLEQYTEIISLKDIVPYLPPPTYTVIEVKGEKYVYPKDEVVTWTHEHQHEQREKIKEILNFGYKKLILVVQYTDQIDELKEKLSEDKPVFVLDGRTKDADAVKTQAQEAEECYFIVQSSMGFGFDGYMFGAVVFVSMSHSCLHHTQMTGRLRNLKHLHPVFYYYLIGGRWDKRIYDTIQEGRDFNPHDYRD